MPPTWLRGDPKELYFSHSANPGSACGQIQVPGLAGSVWGRAAPFQRCILRGCLPEGHRSVKEREAQGPSCLVFTFLKFFIFKLFNLRGWRWDNFPFAG